MGRRKGREGAAVESDYGFLTFLAGPKGCVVDILVYAKVDFKCPPATTMSGLEFEQDGNREVVVRRGSR